MDQILRISQPNAIDARMNSMVVDGELKVKGAVTFKQTSVPGASAIDAGTVASGSPQTEGVGKFEWAVSSGANTFNSGTARKVTLHNSNLLAADNLLLSYTIPSDSTRGLTLSHKAITTAGQVEIQVWNASGSNITGDHEIVVSYVILRRLNV